MADRCILHWAAQNKDLTYRAAPNGGKAGATPNDGLKSGAAPNAKAASTV